MRQWWRLRPYRQTRLRTCEAVGSGGRYGLRADKIVSRKLRLAHSGVRADKIVSRKLRLAPTSAKDEPTAYGQVVDSKINQYT